ncbi:MAG: hypothetical protein JHC31_10240 [Sulfurihydrogenibium sp.]|nr:hypothetical protein [Sulfurihydrogenibium sp.]
MIVKVKKKVIEDAVNKLLSYDPFPQGIWILIYGTTLQLISQSRNGDIYSVVEHNTIEHNTQVLFANAEDVDIKEETEDIMVLEFP